MPITSLRRTSVRSLAALTLSLGLTACDRDQTDDLLIGTNTFLVDEQITSEKYNKWAQAQQNLDRTATDADIISAEDRLGIRRATRGAVDSAVVRLEQNERSRQAIESAGLSVKDYVLTSLALSQAFVASNGTRRTTAVEGIPPENVALVRANSAAFERFRSSRFRVVDDRDTDSDRRDRDTDTDRKRKADKDRGGDRDTDRKRARGNDRDS